MLTGGCYCGALRYEVTAEPIRRGQCNCRECQYLAGGAENYYMIVPATGFRYVKGEPKGFKRPDLDNGATRQFCANCGTELTTLIPGWSDVVALKVGGLDDPSVFGGPDSVIWADDAQPFHILPEGVPIYPRFPTS